MFAGSRDISKFKEWCVKSRYGEMHDDYLMLYDMKGCLLTPSPEMMFGYMLKFLIIKDVVKYNSFMVFVFNNPYNTRFEQLFEKLLEIVESMEQDINVHRVIKNKLEL